MRRGSLFMWASLGLIVGCGGDDSAWKTDQEPNPGPDTGAARDAGSGSSVDTSSAPPDAALPPEEEDELALGRPTAGATAVFVAARGRGSVARIDGRTLQVDPIRVGVDPVAIAVEPGTDNAWVVNAGSSTLSRISPSDQQRAGRTYRTVEYPNSLVLAPDAEWALAWYDNRLADRGDRLGSLQTVGLVRSDRVEGYELSVGFNILGVKVSTDGRYAVAITDAGVSRFEPASVVADGVVAAAGFGSAFAEAGDREIVVTDDLKFAAARHGGFAGLKYFPIDDPAIREVELPGYPTDLDLVPGSDLLLVSLRDENSVARVDLSDRSVEVGTWPGLRTGSLVLSATGEDAWVYTTTGADWVVGRIRHGNLEEDAQRFALRRPPRRVVPSPDGRSAAVLHEPGQAGSATGPDAVVARTPSVSVLDVATGYTKLVVLPVEPRDAVFSPDGSTLWLLLSDGTRRVAGVARVDLRTYAVRTFDFPEPVVAIGVVPGAAALYVSQETRTGRLSFIRFQTEEVTTVSAFELNAWIE